jgi:pimeloyl-ACP methyl ester carboxylesterase
MFLRPDKVPSGAKSLKFTTTRDTTIIYFSPETHQPTFTKSGKDTINPGFTIESVVFESSSGNKLNGWMLKPKNNFCGITLLHLHGNAGFLLNQYQLIAPLVKNGFQVFMVDYSGFGFSTGKATRKNILPDALSAIDYVKARPDVQKTKFVLYGQSLGGHLSAVAAEKRQDVVDGLVIEGGFSSDKDAAASIAGIFGRIFVKQTYSAKRSIAKFHKPVLIIHSSEDRVIPIYLGQKLFKAANGPKEFYEIKKPHIYGTVFYPDEITQKIKNMLSSN